MIIAHSLGKKFGSITALEDVSIEVPPGKVVGLLGPNGAGKSTLFKILSGLIRADSGTFEIHGNGAKRLGAIIEGPALYDYLNAPDNLHVFANAQGYPISKKAITELLEKVGLPTSRKDRVAHFSMGMKQRLGLAIALLNKPAALILDEPFAGLDPSGIDALRILIMELANKENLSILISSHMMEELNRTCQYLYVLRAGKLVAEGQTDTLFSSQTTLYKITASNLQVSTWLKEQQAEIRGKVAWVHLPQQEVPKALTYLLEEGIQVDSCVPQMDWKYFFKAPEK